MDNTRDDLERDKINQKLRCWVGDFLESLNLSPDLIRGHYPPGANLPWLEFALENDIRTVIMRFESTYNSLLLYEVVVWGASDALLEFNWETDIDTGGVNVLELGNPFIPSEEERWYLDNTTFGFTEVLGLLNECKISRVALC